MGGLVCRRGTGVRQNGGRVIKVWAGQREQMTDRCEAGRLGKQRSSVVAAPWATPLWGVSIPVDAPAF